MPNEEKNILKRIPEGECSSLFSGTQFVFSKINLFNVLVSPKSSLWDKSVGLVCLL